MHRIKTEFLKDCKQSHNTLCLSGAAFLKHIFSLSRPCYLGPVASSIWDWTSGSTHWSDITAEPPDTAKHTKIKQLLTEGPLDGFHSYIIGWLEYLHGISYFKPIGTIWFLSFTWSGRDPIGSNQPFTRIRLADTTLAFLWAWSFSLGHNTIHHHAWLPPSQAPPS